VRWVVGLGNPGERYAATRHNVAWRVLEKLALRWHATAETSVPGVYLARLGQVADRPVELLLPQTFMNHSGEAIRRRMQDTEAVASEDLLVVCDDVYLPLSAFRFRARGSSGGHRGLESIESALGHREFARLRIGVGAGVEGAELRERVLEAFGRDEEPVVRDVVSRAAEAVEWWATEGIAKAMNRFNRRIRKEVSES
jgi:PTH1 family peptidyl-tRNA hydrolase